MRSVEFSDLLPRSWQAVVRNSQYFITTSSVCRSCLCTVYLFKLFASLEGLFAPLPLLPSVMKTLCKDAAVAPMLHSYLLH